MRAHSPLLLVGMLGLSGCSLLHSNIKGGFACAAPKGTCAPSMTIDDAAIRSMDGETTEKHKSAPGTDGITPAEVDRNRVFIGPRPALRVVYPSWRDGTGHLHPRTATYVPIDAPSLAPVDVSPLEGAKLGAGRDSNLLAIAELAPDQSLLAGPAPIAKGDASAAALSIPSIRMPGPVTNGMPEPAPEPAKAAPASAGPLEAIRKQVTDILTAAPRPPVATPTPAPAPSAAAGPQKTGGSFPPAGN